MSGTASPLTNLLPTCRRPKETASPKWKLWLLRWAALYPTLLALYAVGGTSLGSLPLSVRLVLTSGLGTLAMTFVWMPWLTRRLRAWLEH
ncbi:MAG: hypothetical protein HY308_18035 [Gammaproteobacteria bacterium]|nr:hypothetical protein [Gammaproteobacteria bacterium]